MNPLLSSSTKKSLPRWLDATIQFLDRQQKKLPLSREGKFWLLFSLGLLATGLFRSINLINLLACFMLAALLHNLWSARRQLRSLRGQRFVEQALFAQTTSPVTLEISNGRARAAHGLALIQQGEMEFIANLRGRQTVDVNMPLLFPERGRHTLGPYRVRCGFPLGLAEFERILAAEEEIIVLPRLGTLRRAALTRHLQQHSPTTGQARTVPRRHPAAQTDFHGLRVFQPGDSPRWIHWRSSARRGELMIKEFEETPTDNLILFVDPYRPGPDADDANLELAISLAATICWEWCRQKGDRILLAIGGDDPIVLGGITSTELALDMLWHLAVQTGSSRTDVPLLLERLGDVELPTAAVMVVSTHACAFFDDLQQEMHRTIAEVDVSQRQYEEFFEKPSDASSAITQRH
jgi:uncharacterized protein (DUF58 family)